MECSALGGTSGSGRGSLGGGWLLLDNRKVHLSLLHLESDVLSGVDSLSTPLDQANVHVRGKGTVVDKVFNELPEVGVDAVLVLGRDPGVDGLLLILLVVARVKRVFDSTDGVLGRLGVEGLVADGSDTTPDSRPHHDLESSGGGVHRSDVVAVDEHVESNVGLGADGHEGFGLVGGIGVGGRVHVPGTADVEGLDVVQSARQLYRLKTDIGVRVNLVASQYAACKQRLVVGVSHTQTSRSVQDHVTLKEAASLESSSPTCRTQLSVWRFVSHDQIMPWTYGHTLGTTVVPAPLVRAVEVFTRVGSCSRELVCSGRAIGGTHGLVLILGGGGGDWQRR